MFMAFHHFASLPHSFASYFITFIPKVKSLSLLGDSLPISLVGSLYKFVDKVIDNRLGVVMDKLISPS